MMSLRKFYLNSARPCFSALKIKHTNGIRFDDEFFLNVIPIHFLLMTSLNELLLYLLLFPQLISEMEIV